MCVFTTLVLFVIRAACAENLDKCVNKNMLETITDGKHVGTDIIKNEILYRPKNYFSTNGVIKGCICDVKTCVQKCCPLKMAFLDSKCVDYDGVLAIDVFDGVRRMDVTDDHFHFIHTEDCKEPYDMDAQKYYVQHNGDLYLSFIDLNEKDNYTLNEFCVENLLDDEAPHTVVYGCYNKDKEEEEVTEHRLAGEC